MVKQKNTISEQDLIKYIDDLIHGCVEQIALHTIGECNNRELWVKNMITQLEKGSWTPALHVVKEEVSDEREESKRDQKTPERARLNVLIQTGEKGIQERSSS